LDVWEGKLLFTGCADHTARAWDVEEAVPISYFDGHEDEILCLQVQEGVLYTGSADNTACAWDVTSGEQSVVFKGHDGSIWTLEVSAYPC
jgi:FOG: WD40 repeat